MLGVSIFIEDHAKSMQNLLNAVVLLNQQSDVEFVRSGLWINNEH